MIIRMKSDRYFRVSGVYKRILSVLLIGVLLFGLSGCGQGEANVISAQGGVVTPQIPVRKKTTINFKNAKKFDKAFNDPIIFNRRSESDIYDGSPLIVQTADKNHFIINMKMKKKHGGAGNAIAKTDLYGKIEWTCPLPNVYPEKVFVGKEGIYVNTLDGFIKISLDGKILYQRTVYEEKDNESIYQYSTLCDDGIVFLIYKHVYRFDRIEERDDFVMNNSVLVKYDFDGNKLWERHYRLDPCYHEDYNASGGILFSQGNDIFYAYLKEKEPAKGAPVVLPYEIERDEYNNLAWPKDSKKNRDLVEKQNVITLIKMNSNGYMKWEKELERKSKKESYCFDLGYNENGLITYGNVLYPDDIDFQYRKSVLCQYDTNGLAVWKNECDFSKKNRWEFRELITYGDSIWGRASEYICQYSLEGDLIDIFKWQGFKIIGWKDDKPILYKY